MVILSTSSFLSSWRVSALALAVRAVSIKFLSGCSWEGDGLPSERSLGAGETSSLGICGTHNPELSGCESSSISLDGFLDSRPDLVVYSWDSSDFSVGDAVMSWCCALPDRPVHLVLGRVSCCYYPCTTERALLLYNRSTVLV